MKGKDLTEMKGVINPKLWKDPDVIKHRELYKYNSLDMIKLRQTYKNFRYSIPHLCFQFLLIKLDLD